jgi:hypothetical protein
MSRATAALLAAGLAAAPAAGSSTGCAFGVKHPAVTAGLVGGTLALATCKLASDNTGACFAVGGGAGAFLGLVTAAALWLGGDGNSIAVEEQAQPLPLEDTRPWRRRRPRPPDPAAVDPSQPAQPSAQPAQPAKPAAPSPDAPAPAAPDPSGPASAPAPSPPATPPPPPR